MTISGPIRQRPSQPLPVDWARIPGQHFSTTLEAQPYPTRSVFDTEPEIRGLYGEYLSPEDIVDTRVGNHITSLPNPVAGLAYTLSSDSIGLYSGTAVPPFILDPYNVDPTMNVRLYGAGSFDNYDGAVEMPLGFPNPWDPNTMQLNNPLMMQPFVPNYADPGMNMGFPWTVNPYAFDLTVPIPPFPGPASVPAQRAVTFCPTAQ